MFQRIFKSFTGLLTCFLLVSYAFAADSPLPMVQNINDNILNVLNKNQSKLKNNPKIIEAAITQYFIPHVDTTGMSRSVLGREAWMKASAQEKAQFTHEFTRLVLRTYAQPLTGYTGEKVEFLPVKASSVPQFSQIQSVIIRPNGQRIPVSYHLVKTAQGDWKVYDLSVEGVSLLNSFRNQFGQALRNEDLNSIISKMHKKNLS
jgi:phospholipid transport system substrate-binding protein